MDQVDFAATTCRRKQIFKICETFGPVKDVGANIIMISRESSEHSMCFGVPKKELGAIVEALNKRFE